MELLCFGAGTIFGLGVAFIAWMIYTVREDTKFIRKINDDSCQYHEEEST